MDFLVLQDLFTLRNGGFSRDTAKMMKKKNNKGKVHSSLSSRNRHITAVSSSLQTPTHSSHNRNGHMSSNQANSSDGNTRLWKLISNGKLEEALTYLDNMVGIPDLAACRTLIEALCSTGRTRKAARVLDLLERSETIDTTRIHSKFMEALCKAGDLDNAFKLLHRRNCKPDVYMYNTLINALFRKGRFEQGMKLLDEMRSQGCKGDAFTCSTVVNAMCRRWRLDEAFKLVTSRSSPYGWTPCIESYNTVLNSMCYTGRFSDAAKLLAGMVDSPSAVTFSILIRTFCNKGLMYRAIVLLESMMPQYGCAPNQYHYNRVIHGLCKQNDMGMAIECIEVMISRDCYPNVVIFNTLLAGLWEHGQVDAGIELFRELIASRSCAANLATYNIVMEGLSRLGRVDEALRVLDEVRGMKGFKPDGIVYVKVIVALIGEGRVEEAMEIWDELKRSQVVVPAKCYNWIIIGLCNAGDVDRGIDVLVEMLLKGRGRVRPRPSHTTYAEVIEAVARAGLGRESVVLLKELILRGAVTRSMSIGVAERLEKMCRLD
ncbi:Pentatricopeptide repeat-containing protein At1g09900 [Linum grandiflorum]